MDVSGDGISAQFPSYSIWFGLQAATANDEDPDEKLREIFDRERAAGTRYVTYDHPTFDENKEAQHVVVSLHPDKDLKALSSRHARDFAKAEKFAKADRPQEFIEWPKRDSDVKFRLGIENRAGEWRSWPGGTCR